MTVMTERDDIVPLRVAVPMAGVKPSDNAECDLEERPNSESETIGIYEDNG
jgi:hypothetical protein